MTIDKHYMRYLLNTIKVLLLLILPAILVTNCKSSKGKSSEKKEYYSSNIIIPQNASQPIQDLAKDLANQLEKATGNNFRITNKKGSGIILTSSTDKTFDKRKINRLNKNTNQSFYLKNTEKALFIYGKTNEAISHGVYYYLEQLGFRWYMPGDNWTITPKLKDIRLNINETVIPDFSIRTLFGSGGFNYPKVLDPNKNIQKQWEQWRDRNRFGSEVILGGHSWEAFNKKKKDILLRHPEYLAEIDGKRIDWYTSAKFCISNPNLVQLFTKDRIERYEQIKKRTNNDPKYFCISVDPADGGKHCTCKKCLAMGTISDRVFYLVNHVAKEIRKKHPEAHVNTSAYHKHAPIPNTKIESNVWIRVIPYAFQSVASPEVFLEDWVSKQKKLVVYDYFSIPPWEFDLPTFDFKEALPQKMKYWKSLGAKGVGVETTYSKGAMGLGLYLYGRLSWDTNTNIERELEAFYSNCFGKAKAPMKRMLERWSAGFMGQEDLAFSYSDLEEAERLAKNKKVKKRINEFKAYVNYLNLFLDYKETKKGDKSKSKKAEKLLKYTWEIYPTMMVHSSYINHVIVHQLEKGNKGVKKRWTSRGKEISTATWNSIKTKSEKDIADEFKKGKKANPKLFDSTPVNKNQKQVKKIPTTTKAFKSAPKSDYSFKLNDNTEMSLHSETKKTVTFKFKSKDTGNPYGVTPISYLSVFDERNKMIFKKNISVINRIENVKVNLPSEGNYRVAFSIRFCELEITAPANVSFGFEEKIICKNCPNKLFFTLPEHINELIFKSKTGRTKIYDGNGKALKLQKLKDQLYKVDVRQCQSNVFTIEKFDEGFHFINVPVRFYAGLGKAIY